MKLSCRPRRLRATSLIRDLVSETTIDPDKLIMPYFIVEGKNKREPIVSMPGIDRVSIDNLLIDIKNDYALGIKYIILFGIPDVKDEVATNAYAENGVVQRAVKELKNKFDDICVITDVCLCEYMSHGHCGIVKDGKILNDETLEILSKIAVSHAKAGADIVAPSDMMDGRVAAIRAKLDQAKFSEIPILSYAAKYSSSFYGPFREAAGSAPTFGDRRSYQMDYRNSDEAIKEVKLDIDEGADIVMVKPALAYLDIINRVKKVASVPVCAYNVSGEYSMVKASAEMGYAIEKNLVLEVITSMFRAGADMIISYHTRDILKNCWFSL